MILSNTTYFLKSRANRPDVNLQSITNDKTDDDLSDKREEILCNTCFQVITSRAERIDIQGGHEHTFANPHGMVFEVGCYKYANCRYSGPPTSEFTWFRGFQWRMAVCGACLSHVGWLFISGGNYLFHGLILNRLIINKE